MNKLRVHLYRPWTEIVKDILGEAKSPEGMAFLLPDGTLVNVWEPHVTTLWTIKEIIGLETIELLPEFLQRGAIRWIFSAERGELNIDLARPPTPAQLRYIFSILVDYQVKTLYVDVRGPDGRPLAISRYFVFPLVGGAVSRFLREAWR